MGSVLLAIETAGSSCSAAVVRDGAVLATECRPLRHGHAEALFPIVDRVMAAARLRPGEVAAVAAAVGPGGFTGIRVGLAAAHGIALTLGVPLVGVSSFTAVAAAVAAGESDGPGALLVALDSRRDDLYVQLFAIGQLSPLSAPAALLPRELAAYADAVIGDDGLLVAGDAAEAAAMTLRARGNVRAAGHIVPSAVGVAAAAQRQLRAGLPTAPARPLYLRPADVTLPNRGPSGPGV